jgi:MYXO-CTERM domain-containing protein
MVSFALFVFRRGVGAVAFAALLLGCGGQPGEEPLDHTSEAETVCAAGATIKGIDVSVYQGAVDWPMVKGDGLAFAIARISDGTALDTKFATNWPAMKSAGLVRGAYQFFEPADDPAAQAAIVVSAVGMLGDGDLPVTADMEVTGGQSEATIAAHLQMWMAAVTAGTGKTPMVYTALGYWNGSVGSSAFEANPLWVANWGVTCPDLPNAWSGWKFWQDSDTGTVDGITGAVDEDEFNGSLADLQSFAGIATTADGGAPSDASDGSDASETEDSAATRDDAGDGSSTGFVTEGSVGSSGGCDVATSRNGASGRWVLLLAGLVAAIRRRRR